MYRSATLKILTLLTCIPLLLSACETYDTPRNSSWDYGRRSPSNAEQPPRPLSDIYRENAENASARTGVDINAQNTEAPINQITQAPAPAPAQTKTSANFPPVKVALLLPLSGKHKALGDSMLKAAQIALFDIDHQNLSLLPQDTKGTPEGANAAARTALAQGAQLVLGPVFADNVRAVRPITSAANVNMIAFSTDWTLANAGRQSGNTFIMGFLPFDQIERLTRHIATKGIRRVGLIAPQTSYGRIVTSAFNNASGRHGISTTATESFAPNTANLSSNIRQFTRHDERQAAGGDPLPPPFEAVLMPVGGQQASSIANLLSHYDLSPRDVKRLGTGLFDDSNLAREPALNGAWFAAPSPNLRRDFEEKFQATYGQTPPRLSTLAYDATALAAVLALRGQKSGGLPSFDRASITNPNGFSGIDGIFRFRSDGTAERGLAILEYSRGRIEIIDDAPRTFQQIGF